MTNPTLAIAAALAATGTLVPTVVIGPDSSMPRLFDLPHREPKGATKEDEKRRIEKAKAKRERKNRERKNWSTVKPVDKK